MFQSTNFFLNFVLLALATDFAIDFYSSASERSDQEMAALQFTMKILGTSLFFLSGVFCYIGSTYDKADAAAKSQINVSSALGCAAFSAVCFYVNFSGLSEK